MRNIRDIHSEKRGGKRPVISFEFFPPKTETGIENLFNKTAPALSELRPDFISVTYGAGGSTRSKTLDIAQRVQNELDLPALLHLTCVNATAADIGQVVEDAKARGISNILALRGDPPSGGEFEKTEGGFEFSYQLIEFLKEKGDFCIGTAGFPEGHVACKDGKQIDWDHLCHKLTAARTLWSLSCFSTIETSLSSATTYFENLVERSPSPWGFSRSFQGNRFVVSPSCVAQN